MLFLAPAVFGVCFVVAYLLVMDAIGKHELFIAEYACFRNLLRLSTWFFIVEFYLNIAAVGIGLTARRHYSLASDAHQVFYFSFTITIWLRTATEPRAGQTGISADEVLAD